MYSVVNLRLCKRQIKRNKWTGIVRKIIGLNLKIDDSKLVKKKATEKKSVEASSY
jgi:hypothetical protein